MPVQPQTSWTILCKLLQHLTSYRNGLYHARSPHLSCVRVNTLEAVQDPGGTVLRASEAASSDNQCPLWEKKALWGTLEAPLMTQNPNNLVLQCTWRTQPAAATTFRSQENQWGFTEAQQSAQVSSKQRNRGKQRPQHPAIKTTLSWQNLRIDVQLQLWCFQSWQRRLRTHLENVKSGSAQRRFVTAKIWLCKMPFWAKCFALLSLCLFLPTQKPSCRCPWEKLYLFLDAVGLYAQRQQSKYTASHSSSKHPPSPSATTAWSTRDLWASERCFLLWSTLLSTSGGAISQGGREGRLEGTGMAAKDLGSATDES